VSALYHPHAPCTAGLRLLNVIDPGLTKFFVNATVVAMLDVDVIEDAATATVALDPLRGRILAALREPASAAGLAHRFGLPRQKVNYHLRALEDCGLVTVAGERRHGGLTERLLVASAASYVVSPAAMQDNAPDPASMADRLSARYLIALAARAVREVGHLMRIAQADTRRLATLAVDTEIGFASAEDQARFADELTDTVTRLAAKYHRPGGRPFRLIVAAHPTPKEQHP
jgi:DNA-binding transcriptional ArsR family regulator